MVATADPQIFVVCSCRGLVLVTGYYHSLVGDALFYVLGRQNTLKWWNFESSGRIFWVDRNNFTYMEVCAKCGASLIPSSERRIRYLHVWSKRCPDILCVLERKDTSIAIVYCQEVYIQCV